MHGGSLFGPNTASPGTNVSRRECHFLHPVLDGISHAPGTSFGTRRLVVVPVGRPFESRSRSYLQGTRGGVPFALGYWRSVRLILIFGGNGHSGVLARLSLCIAVATKIA